MTLLVDLLVVSIRFREDLKDHFGEQIDTAVDGRRNECRGLLDVVFHFVRLLVPGNATVIGGLLLCCLEEQVPSCIRADRRDEQLTSVPRMVKPRSPTLAR